MQTVDRSGFIAWTQGIFFENNGGKIVIAPERDCMAAEEALSRGEKVALTESGNIVSLLIPCESEIKEVPFDGLTI